MEHEFLSTPELAEQVGFSQSALKNYRARGILQPVGRVGRGFVWRSADVDVVKRELAAAGRTARRPMTEAVNE